jgi:hypothetical protein
MSCGDKIARLGLAANLCARIQRLAENGGDECAVINAFVQRLEVGFERYGALDLASDRRDWRKEASEEVDDFVVYREMWRLTAGAP